MLETQGDYGMAGAWMVTLIVVKLAAVVKPLGVVSVNTAGVKGSVAATNVTGRIVLLVPAGTEMNPCPTT